MVAVAFVCPTLDRPEWHESIPKVLCAGLRPRDGLEGCTLRPGSPHCVLGGAIYGLCVCVELWRFEAVLLLDAKRKQLAGPPTHATYECMCMLRAFCSDCRRAGCTGDTRVCLKRFGMTSRNLARMLKCFENGSWDMVSGRRWAQSRTGSSAVSATTLAAVTAATSS